jgi:hypothetical protein
LIEPETRAVSIATRGFAATASARVATAALSTLDGAVPAALPGAAAAVGSPPFRVSSIFCCCRAFSISGRAKKYCQPKSTTIDSTIARMKFLLSPIGPSLLSADFRRRLSSLSRRQAIQAVDHISDKLVERQA